MTALGGLRVSFKPHKNWCTAFLGTRRYRVGLDQDIDREASAEMSTLSSGPSIRMQHFDVTLKGRKRGVGMALLGGERLRRCVDREKSSCGRVSELSYDCTRERACIDCG